MPCYVSYESVHSVELKNMHAHENSIIVVEVTVVFHFWGSKLPFSTKCTEKALVMHYKHLNELYFRKIVLHRKIAHIRPLVAKIQNFKNI